MLIKHKIGLSFLVISLILIMVITADFYQDISEADNFAAHEATAIAQTMALNLTGHTASRPFFIPTIEAKIQESIEAFIEKQERDIFVVDTNQRIVADALSEEIGSIFSHDPNDEVGKTLRDGKPRTFEEKNFMHPKGIKQLAYPLDSSSGERIGVLVLEYTPMYNSILSTIKKNATTHLLSYAAFLPIVLVAGYAYARRLAVPLRKMRNAAREIAAGKEGVQIQYNARDELGELAAGFNKMAVDVAGARKDLLEANERLKSDLEKQRKTEEALVESEQRLRALLDAMPDMILFKDVEGRHLLANKAALDAFGGPENVLGKTVEDLLPHDAAEKCRLNDKEVMRSHKLRQDEESLPDHHGGTMFIDTIRVPLYDAQQNTTGLVVIIRDITEKKISGERTLESLREKEVLLREIHHRVKNNLTVIISLLRLQSGQIENEEVRDIFLESQNRVKAMALVHEKLFSEGNLSRVNFESYVKKLAGDICNSLKTGRKRANISFDVEDVPLDIDTLVPCGLIINELVTNSLKHAFDGQDSPEIRIGLSTQQNDMLSLSVADNGCGIPGDIDVCHCTSLGLQLVQSLVAQIKGDIHVRNDNGTRFEISFQRGLDKGENRLTLI